MAETKKMIMVKGVPELIEAAEKPWWFIGVAVRKKKKKKTMISERN